MLTDLQGQIERITYSNDENGFTIARLKTSGRKDPVTVVGNLPTLAPGEVLKLKGEWSTHPRFGEQFKIVHYQTTAPASVYGIRKYLGSGLIKGIGPVMAARIVKKFGAQTLDIIETNIEKLEQVEGISHKRISMIHTAWIEQKEIRDVMLFLQSHGVGPGYATKIFKRYGNGSIQVVTANPYRLATDIFGIGFVTADQIAEKLGFERNSPLRAKAGLLYVLQQLADEGNVFYPLDPLLEKCNEILGVEKDVVMKAMDEAAEDKKIVMEDGDADSDPQETKEPLRRVYLSRYHASETGAADHLKALLTSPKGFRNIDPDKAVFWVQKQLSIDLAENQIQAIKSVALNKVLVITGGPGTGKTTIINAILKIFTRLHIRIMLAAPTGRAAKRMTETTGHEAKTIHRLLEYSMQNGGFRKNESEPLNCDLLIVDEASMIDTILFYHLLKAIPLHATFVLVGDVNQLPSVGAGNVLKDIISSGTVPVVLLDTIFRQARDSRIIVNAHRINEGLLPETKNEDLKSDFFFIEKDVPETVLRIILDLASDRIPDHFGLNPVDEIQVITPMHKGIVGAGNLNLELQRRLNPGEGGVTRGNRIFRIGDKVMQTRNNYEKDVFNGDMGRITQIDPEQREISIAFDGRKVVFDFVDLDEIVLSYAVSVHKSQGSEFPAIIIPVLTQHYIMLQRNLLYTAVTRGRKLVVLVGTRKALAIAVHNDRMKKRHTFLSERLQTASW